VPTVLSVVNPPSHSAKSLPSAAKLISYLLSLGTLLLLQSQQVQSFPHLQPNRP
jgi:hypothetical protein